MFLIQTLKQGASGAAGYWLSSARCAECKSIAAFWILLKIIHIPKNIRVPSFSVTDEKKVNFMICEIYIIVLAYRVCFRATP